MWLSEQLGRTVVNVEIWSDIACPWCAVGKRRFEAALEQFEHRDDVTVTFRSFELDPDAPPAREGSTAENLARKYGTSLEQALAMNERMTETAAGDGLEFRFDLARGGNTFDAHRLLHLAAAHGRQLELKERLMRAYLGEGELMSDHGALTRLALEAGLPEDEVRDTLATDRYATQAREDEATARSFGISAVPYFVIDRRFGLAGAQPPEVLGEGLRRAWEARTPLSVVADGDTCGPDGC
jgi:predicted DsbA family dithiol-disulfide isomerase